MEITMISVMVMVAIAFMWRLVLFRTNVFSASAPKENLAAIPDKKGAFPGNIRSLPLSQSLLLFVER